MSNMTTKELAEYIEKNFGFKMNKRNAKTQLLSELATLADIDKADIYLSVRTDEGIKVWNDDMAYGYRNPSAYPATKNSYGIEWVVKMLANDIYSIVNARQGFTRTPIINDELKYTRYMTEWIDEEEVLAAINTIIEK